MRAALLAAILLLATSCHRAQRTAIARRSLPPGRGVPGDKPDLAEQAVHAAIVAQDRVTVWYSLSRATQGAVLAQVTPVVREMDAADDDKVGVMARDLGIAMRDLRAMSPEELSIALMTRAGSAEERKALEHETVTGVDLPAPDQAVVTTTAGGLVRQKHLVREDGAWRADLTREIAEAAGSAAR